MSYQKKRFNIFQLAKATTNYYKKLNYLIKSTFNIYWHDKEFSLHELLEKRFFSLKKK